MNKNWLLGILCLLGFFTAKASHNISITIDGCKKPYVVLAYYYGDKTYVADTAYLKGNGSYLFAGEKSLDPGIYLVLYTDDNSYFEILVNNDDQRYNYTTTYFNPNKNLKADNYECSLFCDYVSHMATKGELIAEVNFRSKSFKENNQPDSVAACDRQLKKITKEFIIFRTQIMNEKKGTFLSSVFNAMWELEVPEGISNDKYGAWAYYKNHFWDKFPFSDGRVLRTPVFGRKLTQYVETLTVQQPDSLIESCFKVIDRCTVNAEMFKYTTWMLTYKYENSKMMGFDAVFAALVKRYYATGKVTWMEKDKLDEIVDRAAQLDRILIGRTAPELVLDDMNGKPAKLSSIKADYTIVYFYGNNRYCVNETSALADLIKSSNGKLKVYAVCIESNETDCKAAAIDASFTNVRTDADAISTYDITSTPTLYLLDKNKVILAKRLDTDQIKTFLKDKL
ncbi:MAG: DUF5106 domain-containing protein [Sphingobacteriales bacterium JAD_PAG50586_3]|nr:MAG: DUF5106 domain-containing protein [Sphingobacteriales bacterium JAD_PAG50586_3]